MHHVRLSLNHQFNPLEANDRIHDSHRSLQEIIDHLALLHDLLVQDVVDGVDYNLISDKHVMHTVGHILVSMQLSHDAAAASLDVYAADLPDNKSYKLEDFVVQLDVGAFNRVDSEILNMQPYVDLVHLGHLSFRVLLHG